MWKKDQKTKQTKHNLKLALLALISLGLLLLLGKTFQFFSEFSKPFYALNSQTRQSTWEGNSALNLIVAKEKKEATGADLEQFHFVNLNPQDGTITIIKLSDEILLEVPKNFGSWKLASVYKLGQENKPRIGEDLLKMSVSKLLALPVDGIIEVSSETDLDLQKEMANWRSNILSAFSFLTKIKTDLGLRETMDFISKASKARSDNITSIDLFKSTITQSKLLPDSSRVLGVDGVKLDTFTKQNLSDPVIANEDLTVAVFNGTSHPGLTAEAVRLINNLGARVTIISNTSEKFIKNGIYINNQEGKEIEQSQTYKRLAEVFAVDCLKEGCNIQDREVVSSRSAISIVLGEEYFNYWFSRE